MLENVLFMGIIGSICFTLILIFISFSGIAREIRDEHGNFKGHLSLKSILGFSLLTIFIFCLLYFGNLRLISKLGYEPAFLLLWLNSFLIFFFIHLYDLLIIDYFLIVKWHPKFLKLPDTKFYNQFKPHFAGFLKGIPLGLFASFGVSNYVKFYIFLNLNERYINQASL